MQYFDTRNVLKYTKELLEDINLSQRWRSIGKKTKL